MRGRLDLSALRPIEDIVLCSCVCRSLQWSIIGTCQSEPLERCECLGKISGKVKYLSIRARKKGFHDVLVPSLTPLLFKVL